MVSEGFGGQTGNCVDLCESDESRYCRVKLIGLN
jgi:hypothetical protein